jgi:hypothetical protein
MPMSSHATTRPFDAMESVSVDIPFDQATDRPGPRPLIPEVLYPKLYVWYVFISTMDLILTWIILHIGGSEENFLADWVIARFDLPGVVVFKYGLVLMVISICEIIGRNSYRRGKHLGEWAVGLTFIPVVVAVYQLFHAV